MSCESKLLFHNLRRLLSPQGGDRSEDLNLTREARSDGARGKRQKKKVMSTELHHMQRVGWLGLIKECQDPKRGSIRLGQRQEAE